MTFRNDTWTHLIVVALGVAAACAGVLLLVMRCLDPHLDWRLAGSLAGPLFALTALLLLGIGGLSGVNRTLEVDTEKRQLRLRSSRQRTYWVIAFDELVRIDCHRRAIHFTTRAQERYSLLFCPQARHISDAIAQACALR